MMSRESRSRSSGPMGLAGGSCGITWGPPPSHRGKSGATKQSVNELSRSPVEEDDDDTRRNRNNRRKFERNRQPAKRGNSECRIYVSNIPYEYKWQDLKDLFRNEVGNVSFVDMFDDENGRPRGSAVVEFENYEMAQKAVDKMHRYELKGRKLMVKEKADATHSRDFQNKDKNPRFGGKELNGRSGGLHSRLSFNDNMSDPVDYGNTYGLSVAFLESLSVKGPLVNKVFVSNLDYKVTKEDLKELFKVTGKVLDVDIMCDEEGKNRGFAVVELEHPVQAVQAISMLHNQRYYNRRLTVRMDKIAEKQQKDGPLSKLPPGLESIGMGLGSQGRPVTDIANIPTATSLNPSVLSSGNMSSGMNQGYMSTNSSSNMSSSIPPSFNPAMALMGMAGIDQLSSALASTASNLGMGLGNLGGMGGGGRNMSSGNMMSGGGGGGGGGGGLGNLGSLSSGNFGNQGQGGNPSFSSNSSQSGDRGGYGNVRNMVQITNLPMDYTWQSLKDLCRNYGDIRFAEIRSKGTGMVRYGTEDEARRAADMLDRQRFDGRILDARVV